MAFVCVGKLDALWSGDMQGVLAHGKRVLVVREDSGVYAYEDRCAHQGVPLSEGTLQGGVITCRVHGWCYDSRTGHGVNPARARLQALPVELRAGEVWVDPEPARDSKGDRHGD